MYEITSPSSRKKFEAIDYSHVGWSLRFRIGWCRVDATPESTAVLVSGLSFLAATWAHVRSERLAAAATRWFLAHPSQEEEASSSPLSWVG
jgi:hypothetical protein